MRMHNIRARQGVVKRFLGERMNTPASSPPRVDQQQTHCLPLRLCVREHLSIFLSTYISTNLRRENNETNWQPCNGFFFLVRFGIEYLQVYTDVCRSGEKRVLFYTSDDAKT